MCLWMRIFFSMQVLVFSNFYAFIDSLHLYQMYSYILPQLRMAHPVFFEHISHRLVYHTIAFYPPVHLNTYTDIAIYFSSY